MTSILSVQLVGPLSQRDQRHEACEPQIHNRQPCRHVVNRLRICAQQQIQREPRQEHAKERAHA
jgi:hypothetical protein